MSEKLLTIEEVARYLGLSEKAVKELVESGKLPAYRIGGSFLRFKREQLEVYRRRHPERKEPEKPAAAVRGTKYTFWERLEDFLYYNDFYIVSLIVLIVTALVVFDF